MSLQDTTPPNIEPGNQWDGNYGPYGRNLDVPSMDELNAALKNKAQRTEILIGAAIGVALGLVTVLVYRKVKK